MMHTLKFRVEALAAMGRDDEARLVAEYIAGLPRGAKVREQARRDGAPEAAVPHGTVDMAFMPRIGPFMLENVARIRPDGSDMAGSYRAALNDAPGSGRIVVTAYVTEGRVRDLVELFQQTAVVIKVRHSDAKALGPVETIEVSSSRTGSTLRGIHQAYVHSENTIGTKLLLFQARDAVVKFRISFSLADSGFARGEIHAFLRSFDWPPFDGNPARGRVDLAPGKPDDGDPGRAHKRVGQRLRAEQRERPLAMWWQRLQGLAGEPQSASSNAHRFEAGANG